MKIAPVGLAGSHDLDRLREDCRMATMITHNCEEAFAGARAVAFAVVLADAYDGASRLPVEWLQKLKRADEIQGLADRLHDVG